MALLCRHHPARAQVGTELAVAGTIPLNGAVSMPPASQITFAFSEPVDTTARFLSGLPIGLLDVSGSLASRISGWTVSPALDSITLDVSNPDSSDVAWVITGARSLTGNRLCNPVALNYSTREATGPYQVSGEVSLMWLTKGEGCSDYYPEIIVALLDAPFDGGGEIVAASVVTVFEYTIQGVRPGLYWPTFFFDSDVDGNIVPLFDQAGQTSSEVAVYDPDLNGKADSILVTSSNVSGIGSNFVGGSAGETGSIPHGLRVNSVYPNPFFDNITADFELDHPSGVAVSILDVLGRIRTLSVQGVLPVGSHSLGLSFQDSPSGVYLFVIRAGPARVSRILTHIRR